MPTLETRYCPVCLHKCDSHEDGSFSHWSYCEYESSEAMPALTEIQMLDEKIKRLTDQIKWRNKEVRETKKRLCELKLQLDELKQPIPKDPLCKL